MESSDSKDKIVYVLKRRNHRGIKIHFLLPGDFQRTSSVRFLPSTSHSNLLVILLLHVPRYPWVRTL